MSQPKGSEEATAFNSQGVCACLRHGSRDGTSRQSSYHRRVFITLRSKVFPHGFIDHKIKPYLRTISEAYQVRHANLTYGATPATVGIMPLYRAKNPPSVLYMLTMVPHIPGSFWCCLSLKAAKEADWMESRVRTMSRGYVKVTEVMPAIPPHTKRRRAERSAPGVGSANYRGQVSCQGIISQVINNTYTLVEIVASELNG